MRFPICSPMMTLPCAVTAMPQGTLNTALRPHPSPHPATPDPAIVATPPFASMSRTRWLLPSITRSPVPKTAMVLGDLNDAAVPTPSVIPALPPPAIVVTMPAGVALRIRCENESGQIRLSAASTVMPLGWFNTADVPAPSAQPAAPLPAIVVTTPVGVTRRMRLFPESVTKRFPTEFMAIPRGKLKLAPAPVPSTHAPTLPLPASVVTPPAGVTLRTRLLP